MSHLPLCTTTQSQYPILRADQEDPDGDWHPLEATPAT